MEIISQPKEIDNKLSFLIDEYKQIRIATAWASMGSKSAVKLLELENFSKIRRMVVGTHFYQTHPDFIREFTNSKRRRRVKFILKTNGIYHPKVYLFSNGHKEWECLVGSANFTQSALTRNDEVMVHITSDDNDSNNIYDSLLKLINDYWEQAEVMTDELYHNYRNIWEINHKKIDKLAGKYGGSETPKLSDLSSYTWAEYYEIIQQDERHSFDIRIELLNIARGYFERYVYLAEMEELQRKQIAGTTNKDGWGYFGSNTGAGIFKNRIRMNNPHLSDALDSIPFNGLIVKNHYMAFIEELLQAFPDGGVGIGTATRLLAMKRPDTFLCYNEANMIQLGLEFGIRMPIFVGRNKNYEVYWDKVIERIHDCVWWQSDEPVDEIEAQAWKGRVAMLDAVTYRHQDD